MVALLVERLVAVMVAWSVAKMVDSTAVPTVAQKVDSKVGH